MHKEDIMSNGRKNEYGILYRLSNSPKNNEIINRLKESLSKYNKAITVEEIDEFKSVYLEFVSVYLPQNEVIAKAQKFLRNYQEIERYVHRTSSLEEFKGQVKAELYRFASELFSNAERSDLRYSDSPENVFTYAQDAFAYSRLSTIHQEIWSILHEPLWLLSTEKMIVALTLTEQPHRGDFAEEEKRAFRMNELGMLLSERIRQLKQRIGIVHFSLQERFQNIPLLCDFEIETIAEFVSSYNVCCPHVYGVEPLNTQRLYHAIRVGMVSNEAQNNLVMTLEIWALILKLECQIITLYLVDKAVECLAKVAMNNLALMYENGQGVPKDHKKALRLLEDAIAAGNEQAARNYKRIKRIFD